MKTILVLILGLFWGILAGIRGSDMFIVTLLAMIYFQLSLKD